MTGCSTSVIWDDGYLAYDFGDHPMNPIRLDFTIRLVRLLGVLDAVELVQPVAASEDQLRVAHEQSYLDAVRAANDDLTYEGHGLGTEDNPVFRGIYDASALIAGGSILAARRVWNGASDHAVNIAGGLHHAMRDHASGFCIFNDGVLAIHELLALGAERVAYIDVDVHHGDGVQAAFYADPRVLTISLHQDPRTLFPGTGFPTEIGVGPGEGTSLNVALPPGTTDAGWLRAFSAVVPGALRAFKPDVLVTQIGCDTHHEDPLANLDLSIDGQRLAIERLHQLAHELAGGRWVAFGGGGYGAVRCVPRTWTNLIAETSGRPLSPATAIPAEWTRYVQRWGATVRLPEQMGELTEPPTFRVWQPGDADAVDRAIAATRGAAFPLLGLDPYDPRD